MALLQDEVRQAVNSPSYSLPFLQAGRLARVLPPPEEAASTVRAVRKEEGGSGLPVTVEAEAIWTTVVNFERLGTVDAEGQEVVPPSLSPLSLTQ